MPRQRCPFPHRGAAKNRPSFGLKPTRLVNLASSVQGGTHKRSAARTTFKRAINGNPIALDAEVQSRRMDRVDPVTAAFSAEGSSVTLSSSLKCPLPCSTMISAARFPWKLSFASLIGI